MKRKWPKQNWVEARFIFMTKFPLGLLSEKRKMNPECHRSCIGKLLGGQGLRGSQGLLVK